MKALCYILILQVFLIHCYAQTDSSAANDEIQKVLETQLFPGTRADSNYRFNFSEKFKELTIKTHDGCALNGLLFKADFSKGLIFYLHGSNDALSTWGNIAPLYTHLHYDIFFLDYRGYGKSKGKVTSEKQLFSDVQEVYNYVKSIYPETKIILIGQSVGTGPAAMLAANNHPKKLILQAPYYSLTDWIRNVVPDIDTSIIRYKFKTYEFLQKTKAPVVIFHGDADDAIYYGSSEKLSAFFKQGDQLIKLKGEGHNDFTKNKDYLAALKTLLR